MWNFLILFVCRVVSHRVYYCATYLQAPTLQLKPSDGRAFRYLRFCRTGRTRICTRLLQLAEDGITARGASDSTLLFFFLPACVAPRRSRYEST